MLKIPTEVSVKPKGKTVHSLSHFSRPDPSEKTSKMNTSARQKLDIFIDNNKLSMFDKNSSMSQRSHEDSYRSGYSSEKLTRSLLDVKETKNKLRVVEPSIKVKQPPKIESKKPQEGEKMQPQFTETAAYSHSE